MIINQSIPEEEETPASLCSNKHTPVLSVLGFMMENGDWYKEDALSDLYAKSGYTLRGLVAASNTLMYFIETLDFETSYEPLVKEIELISFIMKSVKAQLQKERIDIEGLFNGRKPSVNENPDKSLYNKAIQMILLHGEDEKGLLEKIKKLLSEYIIKKAIEKVSLNQEKSSYNSNKVLFKLLDSALELSLSNVQLYKEMIHLLKKIVIIWIICLSIHFPVRGDKTQRILQIIYDPETCTPKELLELLEIRIKPEDYLKDILFNADASLYQPNYSKEEVKKLKSSQSILFSLYTINPSLIELPKTYLDFISHYYKSKCILCDQVPSDGEFAICLICGDVICLRKCTRSQLGEDNSYSLEGNLSKHRRKKHAGNGLFLEISSLMIIMIFGNRTLSYLGLNMYCDSIGQNVKAVVAHPFDRQLDSIDFRRFYLNKEVYLYLEKLIKKNMIAVEQVKIGKTDEAVFFVNEL